MNEGRKKTVLYLGYELEDGRAPHQAMAAIYLALNGHRIVYLTISNKAPPEWLKAIPTIEYIAIKGKKWPAVAKICRSIVTYLRSGEIDDFYVQGAQQALIAAWVPVVFRNLRVIYHSQDFKPLITRWYSAGERWVSRRASLVICNEINRAKLMELVHQLPETPKVIRTALPSDWSVASRNQLVRSKLLSCFENSCSKTTKLIVAGGPYMSRRRSEQLVRALSRVGNNYFLIFTGMKDDRARIEECMRVAHEEGVSNRILLLQRLNYNELLSLYAACDIGILLYCDSDLGNFYQGPGRITEYLRAGIPFVASNFPGLELLTLKFDIGNAADPSCPDDISRSIMMASSNADAGGFSQHCISVARGRLAYENDAREVFEPLFSLLSRNDIAAHPFWKVINEAADKASSELAESLLND